jgi:hypothetical protein
MVEIFTKERFDQTRRKQLKKKIEQTYISVHSELQMPSEGD